MACGVDNVDADRWNDAMFTAAVWSWLPNQPDNWKDPANGINEHCATMKVSGDNAGWNDEVCANIKRFACRKPSSPLVWRITPTGGTFDQGHQKCREALGDSFAFSIPSTAQEQKALEHTLINLHYAAF